MIVCNKCNRNFKNDGTFGRHAKDCNCKPGDADKVFKLYQSGKSLREIHALGFDRRLIKTTLKGKTRFISEALKVKFSLNETRKHKDKICIEINGNQHYNKDGTFTDYHKMRETYISLKGWKVFNVKANDVVKRFDQVKQFFKGILYE